MQRRQYDSAAAVASVADGKLKGDCVAVVDWSVQDTFPDYMKYLFAGLTDKQNLLVLEYGCGPGRNILNWSKEFRRIYGVDISNVNLENARKLGEGVLPPEKQPKLFWTQGSDTGGAPDNSYDVCFSVITMHHIVSWSIRDQILRSLHRALKPGGHLGVQFCIHPRGEQQMVPYRQDRFTAGVTNGGFDFAVGDPEEVVKDLTAIGFKNVQYMIAPVPFEISSKFTDFIYFTAKK